jgi:hypothetical protein
MSKQLVLPRKDKEGNYYLSYSQISKFKRSKREYIRQYFFGEDTASEALKKYGAFGHLIGEAFENNDYSAFNEEEKAFMLDTPSYDEFEREIKWELDGFYMKGFIDTNTKPKKYVEHLIDYKTGDIDKRRPEYESDDYIQLDIYSGALQQEFGKLPDTAKVVLIGRSGNAFAGEPLNLTNERATIDKEITKERIEQVKEQVQEIAKEISLLYTTFLKLKPNGDN